MSNFFVVGLPRSRTAWLSAFLSQSGRYCHHDGFNGCVDMDDYRKKLGSDGDSSTGLMLVDLNKEFPDSPVVIIEKNHVELERCIRWANRTYGTDSKDSILGLKAKMDRVDGLRIPQSFINERLEEIWSHLVDVPWNNRYANIAKINIQVDPYDIDLVAAEKFVESIQ